MIEITDKDFVKISKERFNRLELYILLIADKLANKSKIFTVKNINLAKACFESEKDYQKAVIRSKEELLFNPTDDFVEVDTWGGHEDIQIETFSKEVLTDSLRDWTEELLVKQ